MNFLQLEKVIKKDYYTINQLVKMGAFPTRYYFQKAVDQGKIKVEVSVEKRNKKISRQSVLTYFETLASAVSQPKVKKVRLKRVAKQPVMAEPAEKAKMIDPIIEINPVRFTRIPLPENTGMFQSFLNLFKNKKTMELTNV